MFFTCILYIDIGLGINSFNLCKLKGLMEKNKNRPKDATDLRQRAEAAFLEQSARSSEDLASLPPEETRRMLHELRVHQIELEMQNEELRRAQEELDASLARYLDLYDFAPVGYITLSEQGIILETNLAAATLLGEPRSNLVKRPFSGFILKEDQDIYYRHRKLLFESGEPQDCELRLLKKDGATAWVHITATAAEYDSALVCRMVMSDIIEQRRAEAEKADLEARNRRLQKAESLGRMAGAIAHHFNNQLSVVIGNLELVLGDLPGDAKNREALLQSMMAAQKAAVVSRQMLSYLGQTPGKHDPIDLSEACRQSLSLLQAAIPKGMILKADFPASRPIIRSNAGQIQQILTHLITNAWESLPNHQGSIGLAIRTVAPEDIPPSRRISPDWAPQPVPHACLEVSDTGGGISNKDIEKLFDPFFTTKFTGRGMGLAVIRGMVTAQGGGITVDSEPGCGSVFRIYLPLSTEKIPCRQEKPAVPVQKAETGGAVLLIEDEEMVRNMVKAMLTRLGYTVVEARDGVEAVEIFRQRQNEICCVLSDLTMPGMDGWETLIALRKIRADVPVILSSGYDEESVMAGDHPELPQVFLYKPYQMTLLTQALAKAMDHD